MENFLSNFANTSTEVKSSNANLSVSPEFFGSINVHKGALTMKISFCARMHESRYRNYVALDDWDINDTSEISFAGMPIDSLHSLTKMMVESGLGTAAKSLEISNEEFVKEIATQIGQSKKFIDLFGKRAKMFAALSETEKRKVELEYAIENYDKLTKTSYEIRRLVTEGMEGEKIMPTLERIKEELNQLR